jgi:large subunit ribosomal protein L15
MTRRYKKRSRDYLGTRHHGRGNIKRRSGSGVRGGVGKAGLGKHKWFHAIKHGLVGKEKGFFSPRRRLLTSKAVSLEEIERRCLAGEFTKDASGAYQVNLKNTRTKLLGSGKLGVKLSVLADAWSAKAQKKIEASGGKISTA